ncbi:uncharacterized protein CLUP02_08596 [Colletotrichum lupini]|uniref:Uncharacterized protein n=1 Tax=Colletotrichum lupini TaxID=145971 RepID=A0A9Q8STU8_9PEZI|nr:uncharacterized protein CLUP02_08596 [Colletotrichum lupini]UQC83103.1 hypothetical protein CLUP02_08596 [Colletotrichum lupini]
MSPELVAYRFAPAVAEVVSGNRRSISFYSHLNVGSHKVHEGLRDTDTAQSSRELEQLGSACGLSKDDGLSLPCEVAVPVVPEEGPFLLPASRERRQAEAPGSQQHQQQQQQQQARLLRACWQMKKGGRLRKQEQQHQELNKGEDILPAAPDILPPSVAATATRPPVSGTHGHHTSTVPSSSHGLPSLPLTFTFTFTFTLPPLFLLRGLPLHEGTAQLRTPSSVHGRRPEAQTSIGPKGDSNSRSIPYAIMPTVPPATAASRDPFPPPNLRDDLLPVSSTLVYLTQ